MTIPVISLSGKENKNHLILKETYMQKIIRSRILWGILLILAGLVAFLVNIGLAKTNSVFWIIFSLLGAGFFFSFLFEDKRSWWALIPGISLLWITLVILIGWIAPSIKQQWGEAIVFAGIAISFFVVYLIDRNQWWAIIPAGVVLSLSAVAGLDKYWTDRESGGVFIFGLGLTFMVLAILPKKAGKMAWAWIPSFVLMIIGMIVMITEGQIIGYVGSFMIIIIGILMIVRAKRPD
jgi:hypothetical protein